MTTLDHYKAFRKRRLFRIINGALSACGPAPEAHRLAAWRAAAKQDSRARVRD